MTAATTAEGSRTRSDSVTTRMTTPAPPTSEHPEVLTWLAEAKRLFAEAEDRFEAGQVLPALSSLAAVPPLHRMLIERCSELLDAAGEQTDEEVPPGGLYL